MKKTPEQQEKDKLASKLHNANNRMHQAAKDLDLARGASNAHAKSGKSAIKKREKALDEAMQAHSAVERVSLDGSIPEADPPPPKTQENGGRL